MPTSPAPTSGRPLYILGQIFDARRVPGKALEYYRQVADRFTDAASAIQFYTRKDLKVPEVSVIRPQVKPADRRRAIRPRPGLRAVGIDPPGRRSPRPRIHWPGRGSSSSIATSPRPRSRFTRWISMQLYLTRRNLNAIAGIDLAGITPLVEKSVMLGDGSDYDDRSRTIELAARPRKGPTS